MFRFRIFSNRPELLFCSLLIKGFLKDLSSDESSVIEEALKCESEDVYFSDEFSDIME